MASISIVISALALCLSGFTFYWVQLRVKHGLYLVRIEKMDGITNPTFALVNSGTRDILITSVKGWFEGANKKSGISPAQRIEIGEGPSMLLPAGKMVQCRIIFLEPFSKKFVLSGLLQKDSNPAIYELEFEVRVSWVDSFAHNHQRSARIAKYGFTENQGIRTFSPLEAKHDLYSKKRLSQMSPFD